MFFFYRSHLITAATVLALLTTVACATGMTGQQQKAYETYKEKGLLIEEYDLNKAFKFGFLPGGASFYSGDYDVAFFSLILWPVSIVWETGNAKNRAMLLNYEATEREVKKKFKKDKKSLDDRLFVGDISQKEYDKEFDILREKYYNPDSFLLERYQNFATAESKEDDDKSSLSEIEDRIRTTCNAEFTILKKELNVMDRTTFMHKCKLEKRKSFVKLGL